MKQPGVVSVIVPCYNAAKYLDEAVNSIRGQTYSALDIVTVDDGSTDDTKALLERHAREDSRVRVFSGPNRGLSAARNTGMANAVGEFISFLDADDVVLPDKIEKQVEFLNRNPDCDLIHSDLYFSDNKLRLSGFVETRLPAIDAMSAFAKRNWFAPMVPLIRRRLIDKVGQFDESLRASEDWDFWIRCARVGNFGYLPGPVAVYRLHDAQMHHNESLMFDSACKVVRKHFQPGTRLYALAMTCLYWTQAKIRFRAHDYARTAMYVMAAEYHSTRAGWVSWRSRNVYTVIQPVPAGTTLRGTLVQS